MQKHEFVMATPTGLQQKDAHRCSLEWRSLSWLIYNPAHGMNSLSLVPGPWKVSWPPGAWGLLTRKVAVFLWVVVFRPLEQGIEGVLGSGSHLGEGLLEGVEKGRRGGRREGKHTDSKC